MNKLTAQELKQFATQEENVKVMKTLFEAIALSDTITKIVDDKAHEILAKYQFTSDEIVLPNGRVIPSKTILNVNDTYNLKAEDWDVYFQEMDNFYNSDKCPMKPTKQGNCPALESQSIVRNLKIAIADMFAPTLGIKYDQISWKTDSYNNYYDLIMRMFAPQVQTLRTLELLNQ